MTAALLLAAAALVAPQLSSSRLPVARRAPRSARPVAAVAVAGVIALLVITLPVAVVFSAALGAGTGYLRRARRSARVHAQREGRTLSSALELLTAELRAGAHPVRAFDTVAAETAAGSVSAGLRTVAARAALGADVAAGLREAARNSGLPRQWERLAACWQLAAEHGLPIVVLMRAAQLDITDRHRYAAQVDAGMAGARTTAVILAALPALGVVLGELLGARPTAFLSHGIGGGVLIVGVGLLCAGVLWSGRITDRLPT
jgi:tight adherence protein B